MELEIRRPYAHTKEKVEGAAARKILKSVLREIQESILIPEPPHTGVIRRRAVESLKNGQAIWTKPNDWGQASNESTVVFPPPEKVNVVGIIGKDGTFKAVGDDKGASEAARKAIEEAGKGGDKGGSSDATGGK